MALTLGNPNLSGNAQYVQKTGHALLLCLLPYYALGIGDGFFLPALARYPLYFWTYDLIKFVVLPLVYLLCLRRYLRIGPEDYFFTGRQVDYREWEWVGVTFLSALILDAVYLVANAAVQFAYAAVLALMRWLLSAWFDLPAAPLYYEGTFGYGMALPDDRLLRAAVAAFFAVTAGVVEEIFFRGLLRQAIAAILGPQAVKTYIVLSALTFGLAHWEQGSVGLIGATAFGLCAAWLYLKLGDLRPLMLAHASIDLYLYW
jgi:membrane protease YdiL (CAAX protease family)